MHLHLYHALCYIQNISSIRNYYNILLVEHKDRLTRFGFNYIQLLAEEHGKTIEVVNSAENEKEDLIQDFVAVIYSFSAKLYGLRRAKRKTEQIIKEITEGKDE